MIRLISYRGLVASGAWPVSGCLRDIEPVGRDDYLFISHPWLSKTHPDPDNMKWRMLAGWWTRLSSLRDELTDGRHLPLSREEQKEWIRRRFAEARLRTSLITTAGVTGSSGRSGQCKEALRTELSARAKSSSPGCSTQLRASLMGTFGSTPSPQPQIPIVNGSLRWSARITFLKNRFAAQTSRLALGINSMVFPAESTAL